MRDDGTFETVEHVGRDHKLDRKGEEAEDESTESGFHDLGAGTPQGKSYPSLHGLDAKAIPGIGSKAVGDEVELVVRGRIRGASQREDEHTVEVELREGKLQDSEDDE